MPKLIDNEKLLKKCHELAQAQKFEPVPPRLNDLWVARMWLAGVLDALTAMGYDVVEKKK